MLTTPLFPLPEGLEITSISETPEEVLVRVISHRSISLCLLCSTCTAYNKNCIEMSTFQVRERRMYHGNF